MTALRPDLLPTTAELVHLRSVAAGLSAPDLIVRGGTVLHVHTGEWRPADVVVAGRHIAAVTPVGRMEAPATVDATGRFVTPTFLDAHLHIEYTMLTPGELARLSIPRGTTTVLTDADCLANVAGVAGIEYMGRTGTPLRILDQITPVTPVNPALERGGAVIADQDVLDLLSAPTTVTLGESNPFDHSVAATHRFRTALVNGRRITGHTGRQEFESLWGYLAAGVSDDHNAATLPEVLDRVRLGAMVTLMSGSMNDNLDAVLADLEAVAPALRHSCFCADDKHVLDLSGEGHIDHGVRKAIALGVDPAQAYRMATWQPAQYYKVDHLVGSLTPTRLADLMVLPDPREVRPSDVVVGGQVAARDGVALFENTDPVPAFTRDTIHLNPGFGASRLAVRAVGESTQVQAVQMYDGYFKRGYHTTLPVVDGVVQNDLDADVLKVAVVDRHHGEDLVGTAFVKGFTLGAGALAVSTNCTNMNIAVVGASDADMATAVRHLERTGGGFVAVRDGAVLADVPLEVGGLMSAAPWESTRDALAAAHRAAEDLGCRVRAPYMVLSFVGMVVVPDFGVTERGFVDVVQQEFAPLVLQDATGSPLTCRCPGGH
ncbi:adenine deaminase C-terminal domain-containing protein [Kineococcus rhizosphaerae]|uniref:Adenine deaminase n=1 Tax=Kineococcus rhizosphaerae TaxID=559628 RepID=A0A2T0R7V1_9ACTN|nr:adenine deaminase C-terminal domain-containing protein [Kineococcus rhizosphaerae]PRY17231.1 adenine deaminase [Kineococcus rhizosphaerae]